MKDLFFIFTIAGVMFFNSCKKEPVNSVNIDVGTMVFVVDEDGNDLLDPNLSYEKSINLDELWLYNVIDGEEVRVFDSLMDNPKGYRLFEPEGKYDSFRLSVSLMGGHRLTNTRTLLKWTETEVDTIDAHIEVGDGYEITTKLLLNGEQVWSVGNEVDSEQRAITIIK